MKNRSTSIAAALLAGGLVLTGTGCGLVEEVAAEAVSKTSASAEATAEAAPPVRPESVLLDMSNRAVDPALIEMYANPAVDVDISAVVEEFIRVGMSFPELQKGSHKPSVADLKVLDPMRNLVSPEYWQELEEGFAAGLGSSFPITLADGYEVTMADDPADNRQYGADDSGASFISSNDGMTVKPKTWENGAVGVTVGDLKTRLMFTTPEGEIVFLDRTLFLDLYQMETGAWVVTEYGGSVDKDGVIRTQEELDSLPPL